MNGLENISTSLFEKIRGRFPKVVMGDENGAPTSDESQARFFDFDFVVNGENHGAISVSINEQDSLKVYYSQNMLEDVDQLVETRWYDFLKELRFFAKKHMMTFDARDIAKSNLDKRDYQYLASKKVQESAMYGTTKSSYENLDKTRLIIRHKKEITPEQSGARTRNISSLFIENEAGERFKYPYAHLAGARAMARHVANGGLPHDDFGKHIIETSGNIAKLTAFKRYVGKKDFMNTTSNDIIEGSNIELENLRHHIKRLQGQQYYLQTKENYTVTESGDSELGEDVINELTNAFTIPQFNEDLTDLFPLLHKIHQKRVAETTLDLDDVVNEGGFFDPDQPNPGDMVKHRNGAVGKVKKIGTQGDETWVYFKDNATGEMNFGQWKKHVFPVGEEVGAIDGLYDDLLSDLEYVVQGSDDDGQPIGFESFEQWADSVMNEALDKQRIAMLNKLVGKNFPVGPDATNAIESLKGIIDDEGLKSELKNLADEDPQSCARPSIYKFIKTNQPEVLDQLDFGDMTMEDDTTDVVIGKDGAMRIAGDEEESEPKQKKASAEEVLEFVRSFYDKETGAFPKGETGVVISARKQFGDSVGDLVERFVSKLSGKRVEVAPNEKEKEVKKESSELDYITDKLAKILK